MTNPYVIDWIKQTSEFNTSGSESQPSIALYDSGVYVTYTTSGTVEGAGNTNSDYFDIVVMKMNTGGGVVWVKQNSLFNTSGFDFQPKIAVDASGVYVTYVTDGTVAGDGNTNSGGVYDIVVMKMNTAGDVAWIKQQSTFNTSGSDLYPSIAVHASGIYITYYTFGSVEALSADERANDGTTDIVVMKMNTEGEVVWIKQRPSFNTPGNDIEPSIAVDSSGIYITYTTTGTVEGDENMNSGNIDIVVMKMDTEGEVDWIKQRPSFNTSGDDTKPSIAVDASGVYVSCTTSNYYQLGFALLGRKEGGGVTTSDIVVFKLNKTDGTFNWVKQMSIFNTAGSINDIDPKIAVDSSGVYVTYTTDGVAGEGNTNSGDGTSDIVVMRLIEPEPICLLEGTLVRTPTGSVPIELVKIDDYVLNQHYKPVRVVLTSKTTFEYKTNPTSEYELDNVLYTIPAGTLGATSNVYLTRHHRFMTSDGTMKKPEEYGLKRSELSEVCKTSDLYTVYHLRLEDEYNNHFIVNGDCIVEDWWDWPRPDGL